MAKRCGAVGWAGFVAVAVAIMPGPVSACDNPVYRYALERWPADDFVIVAPASAREPLQRELEAIASRGPRPNLAVLDAAEAKHVGREPEAGRMTLLAPADGPRIAGFDEVWSGTATAASLALIADSPARRELAKRLIAGEAIVWVVVERGEADGDAGRKRLDSLIGEYVRDVAAKDAAEEDDQPEDEPATQDGKPIDKSVFWPPRMSLLRVRADDPQERVFVASLVAATEPAVAEGSAVFPVFGRGRTLGGVLLAKLEAEEFRSACDFLTGACSCEVKEMTPGSDLLLAADWNTVPKLIPPKGGEAFADFEQGDESTADTPQPERTEAEPNPTVHASPAATPAAATAPTSTFPAAGRATPPLAVWLAVAAGLLCCLAWLARVSR